MHANNLPSTDRLVQLSPAQPQYRESILSLTIVLLTCCRLRIPARAMSLFTRKAVLRRLVEFSELPLPMCRLPASLLVPPRLSRVPVRALSSASSASLPSRVGVVGGGQMGTGIAYVSSVLSALPVVVVDSRPSQLDSSRAMVRALLDKDERKGKLSSAARREAENRLTFTSDINQLVSDRVPFIIEAVTENVDVKKAIFKALKGVSEEVVLASNTSSISITKLAATAAHPHRVIGMHFMNPVPVMKLVEIITGLQTAASTLSSTVSLAAALGKTVSQSKDVPGFVANRLLMPYINEAVQALSDGTASRDDIDLCMKLGCNMPMGPLQLADFIGLDTCLYIMHTLHSELGDSKYRPAVLLRSYVEAGWLGKKAGRGFYEYSGDQR